MCCWTTSFLVVSVSYMKVYGKMPYIPVLWAFSYYLYFYITGICILFYIIRYTVLLCGICFITLLYIKGGACVTVDIYYTIVLQGVCVTASLPTNLSTGQTPEIHADGKASTLICWPSIASRSKVGSIYSCLFTSCHKSYYHIFFVF